MKKNRLLASLVLPLLLVGCGQSNPAKSLMIKSIEAINPKLDYVVYDPFEEPGIKVNYINGKTETVYGNVFYTGYNMDEIGEYRVTAKYKNQTTSYLINVNECKYSDDSFLGEEVPSKDFKARIASNTVADNLIISNIYFQTGSQGFQSVYRDVTLGTHDLEYERYMWEEFNKMTTSEKEELIEGRENDPRDENGQSIYTKHFDGYVGRIHNRESETSVWIPKTLSRGAYEAAIYTIHAKAIEDYVFEENENNTCTSLYIPKEITRISSNAFEYAYCLTDIYLEHESIPEGFMDGWNRDINVHVNCDIYADIEPERVFRYKNPPLAAGADYLGDPDANYYFGYYGENEQNPFVIEFVEDREDGKSVKRYLECEPTSEYGDGVGNKILGYSYNYRYQFPVHTSSSIKPESIVFHNIFGCDSYSYQIDLSQRYYLKLTIFD